MDLSGVAREVDPPFRKKLSKHKNYFKLLGSLNRSQILTELLTVLKYSITGAYPGFFRWGV